MSFEVAEEDGVYEPATAVVEDNCLKVYNTNIKNPPFYSLWMATVYPCQSGE